MNTYIDHTENPNESLELVNDDGQFATFQAPSMDNSLRDMIERTNEMQNMCAYLNSIRNREDGAYRYTAYDVNLFSIEICDGRGNDCELVKGTAFECFKEVNAHIKYHFGEGYAEYDDKGFFAHWFPGCQAKKENEWAVMEDNGGNN